MYISFEKLPDIPEHPNLWSKYRLKTASFQYLSANHQVDALATTFIRLVEAALIEYQQGASKLKEFFNTHDSVKISSINRSITHFENCIGNTHRAIRYFRKLRGHNSKDPLSLMINSTRPKPAFANDQMFDKILDIRDAIHHLEERVIDGRIKKGQPIALIPAGPETYHPTEPNQTIKSIDRLAIGGYELQFSDLAKCLVDMRNFAEKIVDFGPDNVPMWPFVAIN